MEDPDQDTTTHWQAKPITHRQTHSDSNGCTICQSYRSTQQLRGSDSTTHSYADKTANQQTHEETHSCSNSFPNTHTHKPLLFQPTLQEVVAALPQHQVLLSYVTAAGNVHL